MFSSLSVLPMADVGTIIDSVGKWVQLHIGVTTIRTLGVAATIYGFFMVFRAATSQQGRGGTRWMQAAVALIVGFGMIFAPTFYNDIGTNTSQSVQNAVTNGGKANTNPGDTTDTISLGGQLSQSVSLPQSSGHVVK